MTVKLDSHCPSSETIAALAEGKMSRNEIAALLPHIEECPDCKAELDLANQTIREEATAPHTRRPAWWIGLGIAATVAVVFLVTRSRSSIDALARLAPRSARVVEARLTGDFAYAPYRGPARASDPVVETEQLKLGGKAGEVIERAANDASADAQHAAGVAYVLIAKPRDAVDRLRAAAAARPNDAAMWSDLAAAQYAAAVNGPSPSLLPEALASADHALRIDADRREALFNRALILERLGLTRQARQAWLRYLTADSSSQWATEARAHVSALPVTSGDALFRRALPRIEYAAANDEATLAPMVRRWREQSRAWGEAQYLGQWGEALQRGDVAEAARNLAIARALGRELQKQSGESLLADAVTAIDHADAASRATLAEAHRLYRHGRITYSQRQPSAAEPELLHAAGLFASAGSPMARMARYYAANTRYDQNDIPGARTELEALLADDRGHATHLVSAALIRWELSLCHIVDGDVDGAMVFLNDSVVALRHADERSALGVVEAIIADMLAGSGRPDDAWAARIRSFDALSRDGRGDRLLVNLASTVAAEQRAGNRETALALLAIEREVGREIRDDVLLSSTLTRSAVLSVELGDAVGAKRVLEEVSVLAAHIKDPAFRAIIDANVHFARGATLLHDDPRTASAELDAAAGAYEAMGQRSQAIDARLLRARGALALGAPDEAARQIEAGLAQLQRFDLFLAGRAMDTGVLESGRQLFAEAIRLSLDRGNNALAFGYAERARLRFIDAPVPDAAILASSMESRIAGSDALILEIVVLPEETVLFALDARGLSVTRQRVRREEWSDLATRVAGGDREASSRAFELLVRPLTFLREVRTLIVVSDALLDSMPFAALYDAHTGQYLVEQVRVVMAESVASLRVAPVKSRQRSVFAAALPSGDSAGSITLPDTAAEIADVADAYAQHVVLPESRSTFAAFAAAARDADVVHVSGHTGDDGNGGTSALVFSGRDGAPPERVTWRAIANMLLPRMPIVVLAACDTLRVPRSSGVRAPSLGGAFLAAGAGDVIGTLRPIADREAHQFFRAIHRRLGAGSDAIDAVRDMQLDAIATDRHSSAWSAIALITREIPNRSERGTQS